MGRVVGHSFTLSIQKKSEKRKKKLLSRFVLLTSVLLISCVFGIIVHPAFPLPTTTSPNLQGALKCGFGKAVVACDMPKPCELPSLEKAEMELEIKGKSFTAF